jgi:hypothetical protein
MEQFLEVPEFLGARAGRISECRTALPQKHGRPSWVVRDADGGRRVDTKRDGRGWWESRKDDLLGNCPLRSGSATAFGDPGLRTQYVGTADDRFYRNSGSTCSRR